MSEWRIREERIGDEAAIQAVTAAAFAGHPHSDGSEPAIVAALRADGDLALSLVAEAGHAIVGHIAFSPATLANAELGWFVLGPVSVQPTRQRQGLGRALVEAGVARLRRAGAAGVVVVGDPALYGRFGFTSDTALRIVGPLQAYFQVLPLAGDIPDTEAEFAPAFSAGHANR